MSIVDELAGECTEEKGEEYELELKAISQKLRGIAKENQGLERSLKVFEQLDLQERQLLRETTKTNTQLTVQLSKRLSDFETKFIKSGVAAKKAKTAHESSLQTLKKECRKLEQITGQIVFKEREILYKYKTTQEFQRMHVADIERKALLDPSELEGEIGYRGSAGGYEESKSDQKGNSVAFLQEFEIKMGETIEKERQEKIHEVCDSLQNIHKMFEDLREIVAEQGNTLTEYESNTASADLHSEKTVKELAKTDKRSKRSNLKILLFAVAILIILSVTWGIHFYNHK